MRKTCFVIQGFNKKQDFATGRVLDLDASYEVIKEAVIAADLDCVRADEIRHSGTIDKPMFEQILAADLVIADLSTSNVNAAYELGVRHALRPYATIIVAEEQFKYPFDFSHIAIQKYVHMGDDLGRREAQRFKDALVALIRSIVDAGATDSPVYEFLKPLTPPERVELRRGALSEARAEPAAAGDSFKQRFARARAALDKKELGALRDEILAAARKSSTPPIPEIVPITQQLALATYKRKEPTEAAALEAARVLLRDLGPNDSLDTETLGIWGAIHKRLWDIRHEREALEEAVRSYGRGFELKRDYYNGVNYAFMLNVRAKERAVSEPAEAIADFVLAARTRREVERICLALRGAFSEIPADTPPERAEKERAERYWILATLQETAAALGKNDEASTWKQEAAAYSAAAWMTDTTESQIGKLAPLLADPPTRRLG